MFPPEIVDQFLEALTQRNESVAPCLFVSRAFRHAARRMIFRRIHWTFHLTRTDVRSALLLDVLQGDPTLVECIRTLRVSFSANDRSNAGLSDPSVPALLKTFSQAPVESLEFKAKAPEEPFHFWKLHPNMQIVEAVISLRCLPSLRRLVLDSIWAVPRVLVVGIPSQDAVAHLSMSNVGATSDRSLVFPFTADNIPDFLSDVALESDHPPLTKLESLTVPYPGHFTSYFFPDSDRKPVFTYNLPSLRSLNCGHRISHAEYQHQAIGLLFEKAHKLEEVSLEERFLSKDVLDATCPLYKIKGLRYLRQLNLKATVSNGEEQLHVQAVSQVLDIMVPFRTLEKLSLSFHWNTESQPDSIQALFVTDDSGGWYDLHDTLCHIPSLRRLHLAISLTIVRRLGLTYMHVADDYPPQQELLEYLSLNGRLEVTSELTSNTHSGW